MADNNKKLENSILETAKGITPEVKEKIAPDTMLSKEQQEALSEELELEKKYGDDALQTFGESALSSATFGLSDQALVKFGGKDMQEALRERRKRNATAGTLGEVTGIVGPALFSGGTNIVARGASAGFRTAAKAGKAAEKAASKILSKAVADSANKKIAQKIIKKTVEKGAGSAVEASFYSTGELISEQALGNKEFNAENFVAYAGTGALIGGAAGGVLGSVEALIPIVKNNKVVDYARKKISTNIKSDKAADKLLGRTSREVEKQMNTTWGAQINNNTPKFLRNNLNLKAFDSSEKLYNASKKELSRLGDEIGSVVDEIDDLARARGLEVLPTKSQVAAKVHNNLDEIAENFKNIPDESAKQVLNAVEKRKASWDDWLASTERVTAADLKQIKTQLQKSTRWTRSFDDIPVKGKMDRTVSEAVRREFLELADRVSYSDRALGDRLKKLNLDYGTAVDVTDKLARKVGKEADDSFFKLQDILIADVSISASGFGAAGAIVGAKRFLQSDFRRRLNILIDVEKANNKITNKVSSGVKGFFKNTKKSIPPASSRVLIDNQFATPNPDGSKPKKPKNKAEAFKKTSENITRFVTERGALLDHLSSNAMITTGAAPETGEALSEVLSRAVGFIYEKMPKSNNINGGSQQLFRKDYMPSSLELAKFERYVAAVNDPISVLDDLQEGRVSREGIEALKVVYPDLYSRIQQETMEQIADNPEMPYKKRLQLGVLLDVESDFSLVPNNIDGLQQTFRMQKQAQTAAIGQPGPGNAGAVKTTQGGLQKLSMAEDQMTQTQKVANRS